MHGAYMYLVFKITFTSIQYNYDSVLEKKKKNGQNCSSKYRFSIFLKRKIRQESCIPVKYTHLFFVFFFKKDFPIFWVKNVNQGKQNQVWRPSMFSLLGLHTNRFSPKKKMGLIGKSSKNPLNFCQ